MFNITSIEDIKALQALGFTNEQIVAMTKATEKPAKATGMSKEQKWEIQQEKRKADREDFFKTHKTVRTADENRQLVYDAMGYDPKSGKYFDKQLYKATAKKLGCLGKSGRVVGTYEEIAK